ncbi:MAG: hypothetical protein RIQ89_531 [Bacteroidota bacterium]
MKQTKNIFFNLLLLLILAGLTHLLAAEESDSLNKLFLSSQSDTVKINLLNNISKKYFDNNPDTAIIIATSAVNLAEKNNFKTGLAQALKNVGIGHYLQGRYVEAINNWNKALVVYTTLNDQKGIANMHSNMGAIYFNQGDDATALELYLKALKIAEAIHDTVRIVTSLNNIGSVYLNKSATYDKALDCFFRALPLSKANGDPYNIGLVTVNLGETFYKKGDDSTALVYLNESLKYYENTESAPYSLNYIGRVNVRRKAYLEAIATHQSAFEISKKLDLKLDLTQSLVGLAQAYLSSGNNNLAILNFKAALEAGAPLNAVTEMKDAYQGLTNAYANIKDYTNAYQFQNLLLAIKDTIYNINTDKKLGTLQFTFDLEKKESEINLLTKDKEIQNKEIERQKLVRNGFIGGFAIVLFFAGVVFKQRNRISKEKKRSDELLLNILPEDTAEELKTTGKASTKSFDSVTVLFTDFKNFTQASELLSAEDLVAEINSCYSAFDKIVTKYNIEKIKTIGDAYMCAGGLPVSNTSHPVDVVNAGIEMQAFIQLNKAERMAKGLPYFELRLGIHTGPVVAGVVGTKKFAYDIWGDTVNTASRMESSGEVGKVNISGFTYELIKEHFQCDYRGKIAAKNKGEIDMYFVSTNSIKS